MCSVARPLERNDAGQRSPCKQARNMCRVVDTRNCETDDEIDHDHRQDARSYSSLEKWWDGSAISNSKYQEDAKQAKDGARCACRYRLRMVEVASKHSGDAGHHIENDEACTSIQFLHLRSNDP